MRFKIWDTNITKVIDEHWKKKAFYHQTEMTISDAYKYASEIMIENMMNQDSEEGIAAFLEKRKPNWS